MLDKYHLNKAVLEATARQPEKRGKIYKAIKTNDMNSFKRITLNMLNDASDERERKRIVDFRRYVTNNWDSITIRNEEDCGSSSPNMSRKPRTFLQAKFQGDGLEQGGLKGHVCFEGLHL